MKKALSLFLSLVMLLGTVAIGGSVLTIGASADETDPTATTDYREIEFGWYPQTDVTNWLGSELNALMTAETVWTSYRYYTNTGNGGMNGNMFAADYMRYTDVMYNGAKYRGVTFDTYRPFNTYRATDNDGSNSFQDEQGFETGKIYWFRYDPIRWRVLDRETGLIMANIILDSQPYNNFILEVRDTNGNRDYYGNADNSYYANNYEKSSIREWLNTEFYNTAFSPEQQKNIEFTALDNTADVAAYSSALTNDKIFLLSKSDVLNPDYGFNSSAREQDTARVLDGTNYAKCQGLMGEKYSSTGYSTNSNGNYSWYLRSPGEGFSRTVFTSYGDSTVSGNSAAITLCGTVPALNLDMSSPFNQCSVEETGTGTGSGLGCVGHTPSPASAMKENEVAATCTKEGSYDDVVYCSVCKVELGRETKTIEATGHTLSGYREVPVNEATCTDGGIGRYTGYCSVCNQNIEAEDNKDVLHNPLGHADKDKDGICDACGIVTNACAKAIINVAEAKTVDYKTNVTIKATAENVPEGYILVMNVNGKEIKGTNTEVTYEAGNITSDINYTVKVVDADGNVQKDADGNDLTKDGGKITCNSGFFKKLIAFFKGLFGSLPSVEIKP